MGGKIESPYRLFVAEADGRHERLLGELDHLSVGRGAYEAACREFPDKLVTYRHGARVIAERPAPPPISRLPAPERALLYTARTPT